MKNRQESRKWELKLHRLNGNYFTINSSRTSSSVTAQVEKNFDQAKKQKAIVDRKRAAGVEMELGDVNLKIQTKQRKVVGKQENKKSALASILFS